jgi:hypothetical protein
MEKSFTKDFNKERYIYLLKIENTLQAEGQFLVQENQILNLELLSYRIILSNQFYFNKREEYISLLDQYLIKEIGAMELKLRFFGIFQQDQHQLDRLEQNFEELLDFLVTNKSDRFDMLMTELFEVCEVFGDLPKEGGMNETEFEKAIEDIFLKMKSYSLD